MPRILVSDKLDSVGLEILEKAGVELDLRNGLEGDELLEALRSADGVIVRSQTKLTAERLENPGRLRVIVRAGVGVDNIDIGAATRRGIVVMNTPEGNTLSTCEQTIALLMAVSRHTARADAMVRQGKFKEGRKALVGTQLAGKTIGIIGLGRIGREVARRVMALDMKVIGFDRFLAPSAAEQLGIEMVTELDEMLPKCDYLTVHTPLNDETRGIISTKQLEMMPNTARIINCARGGIIDEDALAEALKTNQIAGAGLDVFVEEPPPADHPLLQLPNVVVTPHLGASTVEAQQSVAIEAAHLISDYLTKGIVGFAINMAAVDRSEMDEVRLYVDLARRLGLVHAQMCRGTIQKATLHYRGDIGERPTRLLTSAFAAGLLEYRLDQNVNIVNAMMLAKERGLEIVEQTSSATGDFSMLLKIEVETDNKTYTAAGTIFGNQYLRLVQLGQYHLDAYMDGVLLLFTHRDVPGLIGFIGTIFGKHNVNIAQMNVGRRDPGGEAIAVLNLDTLPPEEALEEVRQHENISSVSVVKLPPVGEMPPWFG